LAVDHYKIAQSLYPEFGFYFTNNDALNSTIIIVYMYKNIAVDFYSCKDYLELFCDVSEF